MLSPAKNLVPRPATSLVSLGDTFPHYDLPRTIPAPVTKEDISIPLTLTGPLQPKCPTDDRSP